VRSVASISFIDLQFEADFRLDFEKLAAEITPQTRLVRRDLSP